MQFLPEENKSFQQRNRGPMEQVEWAGLGRESGLCVQGQQLLLPAQPLQLWPGLLLQKVPCRSISSCGCRNMEALFNFFFCPDVQKNPLQATKLP